MWEPTTEVIGGNYARASFKLIFSIALFLANAVDDIATPSFVVLLPLNILFVSASTV